MKDAKGHGSEARGGNAVETTYANSKGFGGLGKGHYAQLRSGQMVKLNPKAMIPARNSVGTRAWWVAQIESSSPAGVGHRSGGSTLNPSQHTLVGGGQPVESNAHAAATLAGGGDKSAPVPVHGAMKMSSGDFAALSAAATPHLASTADPAHSAMRQRWDAMHASGFGTAPLYKSGLNDDHIDTALRKIQGK